VDAADKAGSGDEKNQMEEQQQFLIPPPAANLERTSLSANNSVYMQFSPAHSQTASTTMSSSGVSKLR